MPLQIVVHYVWFSVMMTVVAFVVAWLLFPYVLYFARRRRFYDSPNYRKLQRRPVPLMGGVVVYGGILIPSLIVLILWQNPQVIYMLVAMTVLLALGLLDDIYDLPPLLKMGIEIAVMLGILAFNTTGIDSLHGLLGIGQLSLFWKYVVSVLVGVGIINSINLIDGVDGYASGFAFLAAILFGVVFSLSGMPAMTAIAFIIAGAVVPFFLHNVFGRKSKMFMGDGGTLMIGTLFSTFVFSVLKNSSYCCSVLEQQHGVSLIALCMAILSIPVFDTLRLILYRLSLRRSPFSADRNHLHHAFIDLGCSHLATTMAILCLYLIILLAWFLSWLCGASLTLQIAIVFLVSTMATFGVFVLLRYGQRHRTNLYKRMRYWSLGTHYENRHGWIAIQHFLDKM